MSKPKGSEGKIYINVYRNCISGREQREFARPDAESMTDLLEEQKVIVMGKSEKMGRESK